MFEAIGICFNLKRLSFDFRMRGRENGMKILRKIVKNNKLESLVIKGIVV